MKRASVVIKSNAVFTGQTDEVFKGGIAILDNKIAAVEKDNGIDGWIGPDTQVIECNDELVMPGFIDAHMHFFEGAFTESGRMLTGLFDTKSEEECVKLVEAFAKEHPDYQAITGIGWYPSCWDNKLPDKASLDAVISDRPVYLLSVDCHTIWVNSKALEACQITKDTKVSCGKIGKNENGELNGLLFESEAEAPAFERAFLVPDDQMKAMQKEFYYKMAQSGITSTCNMSAVTVVEKNFKEFEIAAELEKSGELTVRLNLYPSLGTDGAFDTVKRLRDDYCSEKLRIAGLKQFVDGVASTYTAYMLEPYSDNPETSGLLNYPEEVYKSCICNANKAGFGVRLHAIGDGAVRLSLDAFEESNRRNDNSNLKNCIEHIESIHPNDIPRFRELGVIASMQPSHVALDDNEKLERIGLERCEYEWPFKSMLTSGAVIAFGTDFPVAHYSPFPGIYTAVTRCNPNGGQTTANPQEKITLAEALKAYTYGGACSFNKEKQLGTLEVGKLADIIVLDKNLFDAPDEEILNTSVILTMMDGEIVYRQ